MTKMAILILTLICIAATSKADGVFTEVSQLLAMWAYNCGRASGLDQAADAMQGRQHTKPSESCARLLFRAGLKENGERNK